jgi:signal transduction histidine kinase
MKFSIRRKLLIGFTLLLVLSYLVLGFSVAVIQQYVLSQVTTILQVEANDGASDIEDFFTQLNNESFGLAKNYSDDQKNFITVAEYTLKNNNYIEEITILSPLGHELEQITPRGPMPEESLSYEVYSDPFKSAVSGTPAISQVYYLADNQEPHIDTYYPIFNNKHSAVGIIKMQVNLNQLREELAHVRLGNNGFLYVVDNNGLLISHPSQSFVLQRPELTSRKLIADALANKKSSVQDEQYTNEKNVPVVAKAIKVSNYNWVAIFEQPTSEAFSFLLFIRNIFIVTLGVSFIFLLLIALFLSENLTGPIRKLKKAAELVESGQTDEIVPIESGDEIQSLSHSFASLVNQLLQRERLLETISTQLRVANDQLKTFDKLKNEFVSVASHELRTPMTSIKSYLWMALNGKGGELNEKQRYYVERGYNSVVRLVRLVNDMLNISRIESGHITIEFQAVNLNALAQEIVDEVIPHATDQGVSIVVHKVPSLPPVLADPDKIKEVLFNLIGNSVKFTPKGGKVFINFSMKDTMVKTIVTDTGAGIAPEDMGKLFQKFGLVPGSYVTNQTTAEGTGLGLYICRSIIELHHGEIKAESSGIGKGATFSFTLRIFNEKEFETYKNSHITQSKEKVGLIHTEM